MSPRGTGLEQTSNELKAIDVWVLDFNQCAEISMDEDGCVKAAAAFRDNDPYDPRPVCSVSSERPGSIRVSKSIPTSTPSKRLQDEELWKFFEERYLEYSRKVMDKAGESNSYELPGIFVRKVVEIGNDRFDKNTLSIASGPPKGISSRLP